MVECLRDTSKKNSIDGIADRRALAIFFTRWLTPIKTSFHSFTL